MRHTQYNKIVLCLITATLIGRGVTGQSAEEAAIPVRKNSEEPASASSSSASGKPSVISRLQSASRGEKLPPVATAEKPVTTKKPSTTEGQKTASSADSSAARSVAKTVKVSVPASKPVSAVSSKSDSSGTSSEKKTASSGTSSGKAQTSSRDSQNSKPSSKSTASAKDVSRASDTKKETVKSTTPSKADVALVKDLQSSARSSSGKKGKSGDSSDDKKSSVESSSSNKEPKESASYVDAEKNPFRKTTSANTAVVNTFPAKDVPVAGDKEAADKKDDSHRDDDHGEEGNLASEIATVPAAPSPAATPNLYLPQTPEKTSLFSKLFGRRHTPAPRGQSTPFSSDYATRGDAILPTVIQGNGFNGRDLPIGLEDPYRFAGLTNEFRPTDLAQIPISLCHYGNQLYLRREAANSLCTMISDAARQGHCIRVVSAYRDYGHQLRLYNQAVSRGGPNQKSVARPGKSEHHLGTTVDLTNNETHALKRSFGNTPEGQWLAANAHRYGWKLTVMSENARRSHNEEPWHLRYLGSHVNSPTGISNVANANPHPQRRSVLGSVSRMLHLGRN